MLTVGYGQCYCLKLPENTQTLHLIVSPLLWGCFRTILGALHQLFLVGIIVNCTDRYPYHSHSKYVILMTTLRGILTLRVCLQAHPPWRVCCWSVRHAACPGRLAWRVVSGSLQAHGRPGKEERNSEFIATFISPLALCPRTLNVG